MHGYMAQYPLYRIAIHTASTAICRSGPVYILDLICCTSAVQVVSVKYIDLVSLRSTWPWSYGLENYTLTWAGHPIFRIG